MGARLASISDDTLWLIANFTGHQLYGQLCLLSTSLRDEYWQESFEAFSLFDPWLWWLVELDIRRCEAEEFSRFLDSYFRSLEDDISD